MTVAVQLYSLREEFTADPVGTLRRLADAGFRRVEAFDLEAHEEVLAEALPAAGLTASSAHASLLASDDPVGLLDAAARLGVATVVEPAVLDGWDGVAGVADIAARLGALVPAARERGLVLGYHNHWWEFGDLDGRPALEVFAEHLDPAVVLEVDVYWAEVAGTRAAPLLARLGPRVRLLHVKDGPIERDPTTQVPAGRGRLHLPAILAAAPHADRVLEFDAYPGDVVEGLRAGRDFLASLDARVRA